MIFGQKCKENNPPPPQKRRLHHFKVLVTMHKATNCPTLQTNDLATEWDWGSH